MTKEEIKFVSDLVVTTLGVQQTEVASILFDIKEDESGEIKPDALKTLFDKSAGRVANFKEAETKAHDKGYSKAKAESITKFETELKEKFGITSEKQGVDLIEFAVAEKLKNQGVELDEEQIKRSTLYLNTIDRLTKDKEVAIKAESDKFNELQTKIQKESTFKTIAEQANEVLNLLKPILPEGKTSEGKSKADIQRERFLRDLGSEYGFEIKDGKTLVTQDGKILEDRYGNMIDFKEIVKQRASELWDFQQGEQRTGTGNNNDASGAGAKKDYSGLIPKSKDEYFKLMADAKDDATKIEITKVWNTESTKQ